MHRSPHTNGVPPELVLMQGLEYSDVGLDGVEFEGRVQPPKGSTLMPLVQPPKGSTLMHLAARCLPHDGMQWP